MSRNGQGTIYQRKDGRWVARYLGKSKYAKTKKEAAELLKQLTTLAASDANDVSRFTVRQLMEQWLETQSVILKPASYDRKESTCVHQIFPTIGNCQVSNLKPADVEFMLAELCRKGYSYSTVKKAFEALNACLRDNARTGKIPNNPAQYVKIPMRKTAKKQSVPCYSEEESKLIQQICEHDRNHAEHGFIYADLFILILHTGLRIGEALALKRSDVDFNLNVLHITKNVVSVKRRNRRNSSKQYETIEQDSTKTISGMRDVPLNSVALDAVKRMIARSPNEHLVIGLKGTVPTASMVDRSFRRLLNRAGIPEQRQYGVHALRHTFATRLLDRGVDIKKVSDILGHSSVRITYDFYVHFIPSMLHSAVAVLTE